jgi:DNA-binding transcriptional LysR family regulator
VWQARRPDGVGALPRVRDISHLLQLVELGEIIAMLPASVAVRFLRDAIRYRPAPELAPARLFVAWLSESQSPEVTSFVHAATRVAASDPSPSSVQATDDRSLVEQSGRNQRQPLANMATDERA